MWYQKSQAANWMSTSNNSNSDHEQYMTQMNRINPYFGLGLDQFCDDDDDLFIDKGIIRTTPKKLYNLPDDKYLVKSIQEHANSNSWMRSNIYSFFKRMPFKWLSNISPLLQNYEDDVIIVDLDTLPDFIKPYVFNFYGLYYGTPGFSRYIYPSDCNVEPLPSNLTFDDFLQYIQKEEKTFGRSESQTHYNSGERVHLFSGIPVEKFFELYFTSGKSHDEIVRFLKNDDHTYDVDLKFIEKEVEKILNKH